MKRSRLVSWARNAALPLLGTTLAAWPCQSLGDTAPGMVDWSATDSRGNAVKAPVADRATLLLFVRVDQPQSQQAMDQVKSLIGAGAAPQVVVIISGETAIADARKLQDGNCPWPVVADPEFTSSGAMSVHVWPTAVVVRPDGKQVAHVAGLPKSFSRNLDSYLAYAAGKIDEATLRQRLDDHEVIVDSEQQIANRHMEVAQRLLEKGMTRQAMLELAEALKHTPKDPAMQLTMADVLLTLSEADKAAAIISQIDPAAAPAWQMQTLRGRVLVAQKKFDEALPLLLDAVKLSPSPADAFYELGIIYQQQSKPAEAAEMFRHAFESTPTGRRLAK